MYIGHMERIFFLQMLPAKLNVRLDKISIMHQKYVILEYGVHENSTVFNTTYSIKASPKDVRLVFFHVILKVALKGPLPC